MTQICFTMAVSPALLLSTDKTRLQLPEEPIPQKMIEHIPWDDIKPVIKFVMAVELFAIRWRQRGCSNFKKTNRPIKNNF